VSPAVSATRTVALEPTSTARTITSGPWEVLNPVILTLEASALAPALPSIAIVLLPTVLEEDVEVVVEVVLAVVEVAAVVVLVEELVLVVEVALVVVVVAPELATIASPIAAQTLVPPAYPIETPDWVEETISYSEPKF